MARGDYKIVSDGVGEPIYAVWDDGTVERAYESSLGMNSGSPFLIPQSLVSKTSGQMYAMSNDPFANSAFLPATYSPATRRQSNETFVDKFAIPAFTLGLGGTAMMAGSSGAELAGGSGADVLAGGSDVLADGAVFEGAGDMFGQQGLYEGGGVLEGAGDVFGPQGLYEGGGVLEGAGDVFGGASEFGLPTELPDLGTLGAGYSVLKDLGLYDLLKGAKDFLPSANTAAALAPILAAIAYAKNQGPFDTSRLESTYDEFDPGSLAFEYDQNTSTGRNALSSSLTNRGVMGSSFGNMDMTNFQTTRDLGRRSLINQGFAARGDMAKALLDAQVKERALKNQLYGQSLLAVGNVFGGKR